MTPEEIKAKELLIKFTSSTDVVKPNLRSKEMALKCIDEMIMQNGKYYLFNGGKLTEEIYKKENAYLFEVKKQIENV